MLTIQLRRDLKFNAAIFFALVYFTLAIWFIPGYFIRDANLVLGLMLAPYICKINTGQFSLRYLLPSVFACAFAIMAPVNTLFFVALLFVVLLLIENTIGKVSDILMLLMLLISPVFTHITRMGEFPLRLWLTTQVAHVLTQTGIQATSAGNQIQLGNYEFSVDPACAGLNMLVMSLLVCLFEIAFYQRQTGKRAAIWLLASLCCLTIGLNVAGNFFRILLLVTFKIMPGTLMHDLTGIGCLVVYVILPLLAIVKPLVARFGIPGIASKEETSTMIIPAVRYPVLHLFFLLIICFIALRITNADNLVKPSGRIELPGYHKKQLDGGILKLENNEALIYLKPTPFYAPEHDPMICWTGSGYEFENIKQDTLAGYTFYTATLQKNKDKIYAAWWFDNGSLKTVNQFAWRWNAAKNNCLFYLVNVNTSSPQKLRSLVGAMLCQNLFSYKLREK